mmetsp:Transcript_13508/g.17879  ORF Transcript_13508/g.17879 Transcript_13508/m.17879 type:complete len:669 (+) Transcript_13508:2-2008(+)
MQRPGDSAPLKLSSEAGLPRVNQTIRNVIAGDLILAIKGLPVKLSASLEDIQSELTDMQEVTLYRFANPQTPLGKVQIDTALQMHSTLTSSVMDNLDVLNSALELSRQAHSYDQKRRETAARLDSLQMLHGLFQSSHDYAVTQATEGGRQKALAASGYVSGAEARNLYRQAWDNFKLAVSMFLMAEAIAAEIRSEIYLAGFVTGKDDSDVRVCAMERDLEQLPGIKKACNDAMKAADTCFPHWHAHTSLQKSEPDQHLVPQKRVAGQPQHLSHQIPTPPKRQVPPVLPPRNCTPVPLTSGPITQPPRQRPSPAPEIIVNKAVMSDLDFDILSSPSSSFVCPPSKPPPLPRVVPDLSEKVESAEEELCKAEEEAMAMTPKQTKTPRNCAVSELVDTELTYFHTLQKIIRIGDAMKPLMTGPQFKCIFASISMLLPLHSNLLVGLEKRLIQTGHDRLRGGGGSEEGPTFTSETLEVAALGWPDNQLVSDVINDYFPHLKMYTSFSDNYEEMIRVLDSLKSEEDALFSRVLHKAMQDNGCVGEFESLMIQPVQRIPRYPLLLSRILELTTDDHPDHCGLAEALEQVEKVAHHVNKSMHTRTEQLQLLELQNSFFPKVVVVKPGRSIVKRGELNKIMTKDSSIKRYHVFLFNDSVAYGSQLMMGYYNIHRFM